jgi:hypothetical protein
VPVIDKEWQIALLGLQQAKHRLRIELNTGMKFRQSTLKVLQRAGYTKARTREDALADIEGMLSKIEQGFMRYNTTTHRWEDIPD